MRPRLGTAKREFVTRRQGSRVRDVPCCRPDVPWQLRTPLLARLAPAQPLPPHTQGSASASLQSHARCPVDGLGESGVRRAHEASGSTLASQRPAAASSTGRRHRQAGRRRAGPVGPINPPARRRYPRATRITGAACKQPGHSLAHKVRALSCNGDKQWQPQPRGVQPAPLPLAAGGARIATSCHIMSRRMQSDCSLERPADGQL